MIVANVNDLQVKINLKNLGRMVEAGIPKHLLDIGFEVLRKSQEQVPHDKGDLQNSGTVETIGKDVVVGYHEPYAARLHEHPEYNFKKGRKGRYLTDPVRTHQQALGLKLSSEIGEDIRKAIK